MGIAAQGPLAPYAKQFPSSFPRFGALSLAPLSQPDKFLQPQQQKSLITAYFDNTKH
jgi:hypothetical protein